MSVLYWDTVRLYWRYCRNMLTICDRRSSAYCDSIFNIISTIYKLCILTYIRYFFNIWGPALYPECKSINSTFCKRSFEDASVVSLDMVNPKSMEIQELPSINTAFKLSISMKNTNVISCNMTSILATCDLNSTYDVRCKYWISINVLSLDSHCRNRRVSSDQYHFQTGLSRLHRRPFWSSMFSLCLQTWQLQEWNPWQWRLQL
jgi:hypothetical protein